MRNYTFGTLLAVFSLQCNNIGFVDKAKAVANNEFGVDVFNVRNTTTVTGGFLGAGTIVDIACDSLGGIAKANCNCASRARTLGKAGTYRAWLSLSSLVDAICNIQGKEEINCSVDSTYGPFFATTSFSSGVTVLAENYAELSSTGFRSGIDTLNDTLWSGTNLSGRATGSDCAHFTTSGASQATTGLSGANGSGFTATSNTTACSTANGSFLCMRQSK